MQKIKRPLQYDPRLAGQLANWAIKKDVVRALVELITNSDDSYRRLSANGIPGSGIIKINLYRKRGSGSFVEVIDEAEGFDYKTMEGRVGTYASDTSGFSKGMAVRGYFGRGLKDAILGLGEGKIQSLKDSYYYECSLNQSEFILEEPEKITKKNKKGYEVKLDLKNHGTKVVLFINRPDVSIPYFDNFIELLSRYYSLRDINSSNKRTIIITEIYADGSPKRPSQNLEYRNPLGKLLIDEKITIPYGDSATAKLCIYRSDDQLDISTPCGDGGILVCSKHSIHDLTLFGFDNNQYADRIFGRIECKYIDDLIKKGEPIISDKRDGLDWKHEFARELKAAAVKKIKPILDQIKKEEEKKKKEIENEKTRQRFLCAIKKLNEIAKDELGDSSTGIIEGEDDPEVMLPPNGFDFIPEYYKIIVSRKSSLSLKMVVPWIIKNGEKIKIDTDNEDLEVVENREFVADSAQTNEKNVLIVNPKLIGKRVGVESIVTANANDRKAEAFVKVVSKIERKSSGKRKRTSKSGLFSEIKYDSSLDERIRHYFDRENGIIKISSNAPSVKKYLGPNGEGQDELHCQVFIAELVSDAVCRELARRKAELNRLPTLAEDITTAISKEIDSLVFKYSHTIHTLLVDR